MSRPRILGYYGVLSLFLLFGLPRAAHAGLMTISDLIGGVHVQPTTVRSDLTKVWDVESHNGVLYVAGELNDSPAYQAFDLTTGVPVAGPVRVLTTTQGADGQNGDVRDIALVNGQVTFIGEALVGPALQGGTWDLAGNLTPVPSNSLGGLLLQGNSSGIVVGGGDSDDAAVGKIGGSLVLLPEAAAGGTAISITEDGKWIVGGSGFAAAAWHSDSPESLSYALQSLSLQGNANGDLPYDFRSVILDPISGHYIAFGEYTDSVIVADSVAAWDLSDGSLLRDFGAGTLEDVRLFGDNVVVDVNGIDFGYLTTLHSPEILAISDLLGPDVVFSAKGGLFEGSLGVFALG